jgi:hypothetical protein
MTNDLAMELTQEIVIRLRQEDAAIADMFRNQKKLKSQDFYVKDPSISRGPQT